jgi:hypothetical protein
MGKDWEFCLFDIYMLHMLPFVLLRRIPVLGGLIEELVVLSICLLSMGNCYKKSSTYNAE